MGFTVGWSLRDRACGCAAAPVEQGSKAQSPSAKMQKAPEGAFLILAERVGFEPTVRENRTLDFESSSFDHSDTSPGSLLDHEFDNLLPWTRKIAPKPK